MTGVEAKVDGANIAVRVCELKGYERGQGWSKANTRCGGGDDESVAELLCWGVVVVIQTENSFRVRSVEAIPIDNRPAVKWLRSC